MSETLDCTNCCIADFKHSLCDCNGDFCTKYKSIGDENDFMQAVLADRPSGEWIPATWQDENCPERLKKHKCSVCGEKAERILVRTELIDNYYCNKCEPITEYTHQEQLSDFCPHCGARMKGAEDERDS